jgi:hypothetical protein
MKRRDRVLCCDSNSKRIVLYMFCTDFVHTLCTGVNDLGTFAISTAGYRGAYPLAQHFPTRIQNQG